MKITFPTLDAEQVEDETIDLPLTIHGVDHLITLYPCAAKDVPSIDAVFQFYSIPGLKTQIEKAEYPHEAERKKALIELAKQEAKRYKKVIELGVNLEDTTGIWAMLLGPAHPQLLEAGASSEQVRKCAITALVWHALGSVESAMATWSGKAQSETSEAVESTLSDRTGAEESEAPQESGATTTTPTTT